METVYTYKGCVKRKINNNEAKVLESVEMHAVGEIGKNFLIRIAEQQLNTWNDIYITNDKRRKNFAICTVCSNMVSENNGLLIRDNMVFGKRIKAPMKKAV